MSAWVCVHRERVCMGVNVWVCGRVWVGGERVCVYGWVCVCVVSMYGCVCVCLVRPCIGIKKYPCCKFFFPVYV